MPWSPPIPFAPGINTVRTPVLNGSGWSDSNLIRFRDGIPEKNGGWARLSDQTLLGVARGMNVWSDLTGLPYAAFGTEQRLEVLSLAGISDITPLIGTTNNAPDFSTIATSNVVTVVDADVPVTLAIGDWVNINIPVSVGGIVVHGFVQVTDLPGINAFSFNWTSAATGTINNGGAVPSYTTTNLSTTFSVTLANHGLSTNDSYVNEVSTTVGGRVLADYAVFEVSNVVNANVFQFLNPLAATGNDTVSENAGNAQILYLIPTGFSTATLIAGFGVGMFSAGFYGRSGNGPTYTTIRQWFMDQWGQYLVANYPGSPIFIWVPPVALGNVALAINSDNFTVTSPPTMVNFSFVAMPEQIIIALGCDPPGGDQDPNLIRWCDVGDFTDWVASATNQAGSYRIPTGSRLVGGVAGSTFGAVWTDEDMYIFNYIGFPLVFGFNRVSGGAGLLAARCSALAGGVLYWASPDNVYRFDGSSASIVPCPVWDTMWRNLNKVQVDKCFMGVNSLFNEFAIFFPSLTGTGEVDSYIRYNWRENIWDIGAMGTLLARTCWHDYNDLGPPIGVDVGALIQQQEIAYDADGAQMGEYIVSGYFSIDNGWLFTIINQIVSDFKYEGTGAQLQFWVMTKQYPKDTPVIYGPFTDTPTSPDFEAIGARGRMAAIKIGMSTVGSWWRLGWYRYLFAPDGSL